MTSRRSPHDRMDPLRGSAAGISAQERMRLIVFFTLGVIVTGALLYALRWAGDAGNVEAPTKGEGGVDPRIEIDVPVNPWKPPVDEVNRLVGETSRALRVQTYPRALALLATSLRNHTAASFLNDPAYEAVGGFERVDVGRFGVDNAAEMRAHPIEVVGTVRDVLTVSPSEDLQLSAEDFPLPMQRGVIDVDGQELLFLALDPATRSVGRLILPGEKLKLRGVFYRMMDVPRSWAEAPAERDAFATLPMMLVKDVLEAVPLRLVETLPEDFGDRLRELDLAQTMVAPQRDATFYTLLGYVLANGEKLLEDVEPRLLTGREPRDDPDDYVLDVVRAKGQIVYLKWESFDIKGMREEDAPILGYWHAVVSDARPDVNVPIQVIFPFDELPEGIRKNTLVDVPGLFFRVHAYDNQQGSESALPMMIAATPPVVKQLPPDTTQRDFIWAFAGIGLALVAGLLVMLARDKRRSRDLDSQIRERRQSRRRASGFDLNKARPPEDSPPS